jgi:parvulin-like peptidyl-prolyl isomerase
MSNVTRKQFADAVWNDILTEELVGGNCADLGITIGPKELLKRIMQNPNIANNQTFKDPATGMFSEEAFKTAINNLRDNRNQDEQSAEFWAQWLRFQDEIKTLSLYQKYYKAVELGVYAPKALARQEMLRNTEVVSARYLYLPFDEIQDSTLAPTESELKKYYKANRADFKTEPYRNLAFATFTIAPSTADVEEIKSDLTALLTARVDYNPDTKTYDTLPGFAATREDSAFVVQNSDLPYVGEWYRKGDLPAGPDSVLFNLGIGQTYGPYVSDNQAEIAKVLGKQSLPDSARASHILIAFNGSQAQPKTPRDMARAKALADSLEGVVRSNPASFAALVQQYSDDAGSAVKEGDLDWFGPTQMVKPFADFCFENSNGSLGVVMSQFGYHVIQITGQKGSSPSVKVARVVRTIAPTETTLNDLYSRASKLAASAVDAEAFGTLANEAGVQPRPAANVKAFDENIPGLGNNREVVRWAFDESRKVGDKQVFSTNGSYAVVLLTDIVDEEYQPLEAVRSELEAKVLNEKKADRLEEQVKAALEGASSLDDLAKALNRTAQSVALTMSQTALVGIGNEPKVIGAMHGIAVGQLSAPIRGNRGVFVVTAESRQPAGDSGDYAQWKSKLEQSVVPNVSNDVFTTLEKGAKIKDNRARFF